MAKNKEFFLKQTEQSRVKAEIVNDYFSAWAKIMINHWKSDIVYIDLFCGPGKYKDNIDSVPLRILNKVIDDPKLSSRIIFYFNDSNPSYIENLIQEIKLLSIREPLIKRINVMCTEVDVEFSDKVFISENIPVLSFVDPWGYKGLTLELINKLIENNGSDCIFFFNYNRINMALGNNSFDTHLLGLFGENVTKELKNKLRYLTVSQREKVIIAELCKVLNNNGANYVLPFKFYSKEMLRTSHFIIFVTKHQLGCKIMKQIMHKHSAKDPYGVAKFSYEDSNNFNGDEAEQIDLFSQTIDALCSELLRKYQGEKLMIKDICDKYMFDTSNYYIDANVKDALRQLEQNNKIIVEGRKQKMRNGKPTMPDGAYVVFR